MSAVADVETQELPSPAPAESAPRSLYKYATWVHVGPGAEDCSEVSELEGTNACGDSGHFHAWCRVPNALQEKEIRDRALAAKARKMRQMRTDGTDANEILEAGLEELRADPEGDRRMADELLGYDWTQDYMAAVRQVRDLDDETPGVEEGTKLYAHIDDDRLRFVHLQSEPEEERNKDEFEELQRHLKAYETAVTEHYEAIASPKRDSYLGMAPDDLVELVRQKRIQFASQQEFMHHYNIHEWLSCTYRSQAVQTPVFDSLAALQGAAAEVLEVLSETFADLERTAQAAQGN